MQFELPDKGTVYRLIWNEVQTALADFVGCQVIDETLKLMTERVKAVMHRMDHEFPGYFVQIIPEAEGVRDEKDPTMVHITYVHNRKKQIPEFRIVKCDTDIRNVEIEALNDMAKEILEYIAGKQCG